MIDGTMPNTAETMRELQPFMRAVDLSLDATQHCFGIESTSEYSVQLTDDEIFATFPATIDFSTDIVHIHTPSFDQASATTTQLYPEVTYLDLAKLHVATALIPGIISQAISPRNGFAVNQLYDHITSTDAVEVQVADALLALGLNSEAMVRLAIACREEEEVVQLNKYRLAAGTLALYESQTSVEKASDREAVDFGGRLTTVFRGGLIEAQRELQKYVRFAKVMSGQEHKVEQLFHKEISPFEIAAAFPMEVDELMVIAKYIGMAR